MRDRGSGTVSRTVDLRVVAKREPKEANQPEHPGDRLSRQRRLQHARGLCHLRGTGTYLVHLHMVAVSVAALWVVTQQHIGALFAQQVGEDRGSLVGRY